MDDAIIASGLYEKYNIDTCEDMIHILVELDGTIEELRKEEQRGLINELRGKIKAEKQKLDNQYKTFQYVVEQRDYALSTIEEQRDLISALEAIIAEQNKELAEKDEALKFVRYLLSRVEPLSSFSNHGRMIVNRQMQSITNKINEWDDK